MLKLRYRGETSVPVEAECITPDSLVGKSSAEIAALTIFHGNREVPLGEFFSVEGDANDGEIAIEGDCGRVKWIGAGMTRGHIRFAGDVGMHVGSEMKRGTIALFGPPAPLLPTFRFDCVYRPVFVDLYLRQLREWGFTPAQRQFDPPFRRYSGDLVTLGKGEVLQWQGAGA